MRPTRSSARRSSFTLIELVAVMVVIGIVSVIVGGPTLAYIDDIRASAAASRLSADIRYMQRMALASGHRTWIVVNPGADSYALYAEDAANPGKAGRMPVVHPLDQTSNAMQFGSGPFANVSITGASFNSTPELEFDSFGIPYDASGTALTAAGQITLSNGVAAQVQPVSGFVESVSWP